MAPSFLLRIVVLLWRIPNEPMHHIAVYDGYDMIVRQGLNTPKTPIIVNIMQVESISLQKLGILHVFKDEITDVDGFRDFLFFANPV
jgi:hypothetical protein